jgi:peroxiredoxin
MAGVNQVGPMEGDLAPDFELPEASDRPVRLSQELEHDRVILLFYPNDFGVICTIMLKRFKDEYPLLRRDGFEVMAVNRNSCYTHRTFKSHLDLPYLVLSDEDGRVSNAYGGIIKDGLMEGRSNRAAFVIDRDRRLAYSWIATDPNSLPEFDRIIESARSLPRGMNLYLPAAAKLA